MRKAPEERFCSNCRAAVPPKATECPACGVYAGDLYDERMHRPKTRAGFFGTLLIVTLVAGGAAIWWSARESLPPRKPPATDAPPVRVVRDRPGGVKRAPGAKINQAEAIRLVRRHLVVTSGIKSDCVALIGRGTKGGAYIVAARDTCTDTRLGQWQVDAKSGEVARAR